VTLRCPGGKLQGVHQYLVTLAVQLEPGIDVPSIVIKVQMSDSLYASTNAAERQEIIKTYAKETVANARGKIWASARVPLSINVTDLSPIKAPITETALPDHQISSDVLAWVKKPASPFASQ
jgi:hypothetical protein